MPSTQVQTHEVADDVLCASQYCYEQGWLDGLPVAPSEVQLVEAMQELEGRPPETVLATHPTTGIECTVHAAAANAVMAGCLPEYFPVLVAAVGPEYSCRGPWKIVMMESLNDRKFDHLPPRHCDHNVARTHQSSRSGAATRGSCPFNRYVES